MIEPLSRTNQVEAPAEAWRPPLFQPVLSRRDRAATAARRFLDLQAGSIWSDLAQLLPQSRGVVLDVGCGAQPYRRLVDGRATYRAIDHAAAQHFGYSMPDTTYYDGDTWPVAEASVDVVLSTETLEHVPEPRVFLAEAYRCLKPGGHLILTVPFAARWHFIPYDYWRYTPSSLLRLLAAAGFSEIAVWARGNALTVACYKAMALPLRLLFPQGTGSVGRLLARACGALTLPVLAVLAVIANMSLRGDGGNDCLGYTALAYKNVP
jgi:SAM-dependent methyltransferase